MKSSLQSWRHRFGLKYNTWLLHSLTRVTFWSEKFRQRLSPMGLALLAAVVITLIFGADTKSSTIYQLFSLFVALLFVSLVSVWFFNKRHKKHIEVDRILPNFATVGVDTHYQIQLQNNGDIQYYQLSVQEFDRLPIPTLKQFLHMSEPDEAQRNWYDRHTGFYRFVWLQAWLRGAVFTPQSVATLQQGQVYCCDIPLSPMRRGYIHLSNIRLRFPEPLALAYVFEDHQKADVLLVLPKAYRLPTQLFFSGRQAYQQSDVAQTSAVGESEAFSRLREYREGDSPRHMHWPSWASAQQPLIKEFEAMCFARATLILDNFTQNEQNQNLEEAISVAAGFAMQNGEHGMLFDLLFTGEEVDFDKMKTGRLLLHAEQMLETLALLQPCQKHDFSILSKYILRQSDQLQACVLILLVWDEARQSLVQQLLALSIPLRIFLMDDGQNALVSEDVLALADVHVLRLAHVQDDLDSIV